MNKAGYVFAGWSDYNTGLTNPVGGTWDDAVLTLKPEDLITNLSNIGTNKIIKAAYNETNAIVATLPDDPSMYAVTYSPFVSGGGGLQTTFTVTRNSSSRRAREGEVYLVIELRPLGRGLTRIRVPLGKSDVETFTLTMPNNAASIYSETNAISYSLEDKDSESKAWSEDINRSVIIKH